MSTANTSRPICGLVRAWVGIFSNSSAERNPGYCGRHLAACACCQRFFATGDELDQSLRLAAKDPSPALPTGMERRILNAVERSRFSPPPRRPAPLVLAFGAAACLTLLALISKNGPEMENSPAPRPILAASENLGEPNPDDLWSRLQPSTDALLNATPLQTEADAVYSDAQAALGFLALNFLPDPTGGGEPR